MASVRRGYFRRRIRRHRRAPPVTKRCTRRQLKCEQAGSVYAQGMSAERDELRRLVEKLPDEDVPGVLAELRQHVPHSAVRPWPPAFFGAGRASRPDGAERSEDLLDEGFGRPA